MINLDLSYKKFTFYQAQILHILVDINKNEFLKVLF